MNLYKNNEEAIAKITSNYSGRDRKIAVWDMYGWKNDTNPKIKFHPDCVTDRIKARRPDAEIKIFNFSADIEGTMEEILKFADGRMIAVNMSMTGINFDVYDEMARLRNDPNKDVYERFHNSVFFVVASGNDGECVQKYPAATETFKDKCYAVGALDKDGTVKGYSNWNKKLDGVDFTDGPTRYGPFGGTSGAAPEVTAKVDMFIEMYIYTYGKDPTVTEINEYIKNRRQSIKSEKAGNGLLIMEVLKVKHEVKMKIPYKGAKRHVKQIQYLDSAITYTDNKTGKAIGQAFKDSEGKNGRPMIITHEGTDQNGDGLLDKDVPDNMFMPARMLGETLGYDVIWDDETDTVTFRSKEDIVPIRRV